jgi:hypothetical protein
MARRLAVDMAFFFAVFLAIAEVVRNWGDWGFWPFWVVDYIAVALLLIGWRASQSAKPWASAFLAGGWGFTCAMFYMSFFSHLEIIEQPDHGPIEQRPLTLIIGVLFAMTIVGFASAIIAAMPDGPHVAEATSRPD